MAILTTSRLADLTESKFGIRTFTDLVNESKRESKSASQVSIFLSHSHDDLDRYNVQKTIVLLRGLGIRVYIDSQDSSLPPFTSAETARRIKEQIEQNNKFILLATNKAIASKWCNWELGYGDAKKYINHLALFPLADTASTWNGNEYLQIYPRIEESIILNEHFKIIYPDGTEIELKKWLLS